MDNTSTVAELIKGHSEKKKQKNDTFKLINANLYQINNLPSYVSGLKDNSEIIVE